MGAMVVALGFAVLFWFVILRLKWNRGMYADIGVDTSIMVLLNVVFGGSILGVVSATAGSTLITLYLLWKPIQMWDEIKQGEDGSSEPKSALDIRMDIMREKLERFIDQTNKGKI